MRPDVCRANARTPKRKCLITAEGRTPMSSPVIYVIDNDAAVRSAVQRLLVPLRRRVHAFASAEQFLREVDTGAEGCLILDVSLPGMNGLKLHERLKESGWKLPVIFTTGGHDDRHGRDDDDDEQQHWRDHALRNGAVAYFHKPFDADHFLAAVRS